MACTVSGSKTCTISIAPHLSATALTALLAIGVENLTVDQFNQIADAIRRCGKAADHTATIGSFLN